jgi:hypothetical protein
MAGSFGFGLAHAFEVDHMTAVSAFVATKPRPRAAASFGARWAVGHGLALLVFGSALYALKLAVTPAVSELFERAVGLALLALGVVTLRKLRRDVSHSHHHHHDHRALWMGLLHGIAGTAAFAGQAIVVASQSYGFVLAYTLAFSLGVLVSMVVFAGTLGAVLTRGGRWLQLALGLWACAVGLVWLLGFGA